MSPSGQNSPEIDGGRPAMLPEMDRQSVRFQHLSSLLILPRVHSFFIEVNKGGQCKFVADYNPYCLTKKTCAGY